MHTPRRLRPRREPILIQFARELTVNEVDVLRAGLKKAFGARRKAVIVTGVAS